MFCPQCRAEFPASSEQCADCEVPLVATLPPVDHTAEEQIVVCETSRPSDIPVIKSLLRAAEIPFFTEGESLNRLFPSELHITMIPGGHPVVHFLVPASRAEEAHTLLVQNPELAEPAPEELRQSS